MFEPRVEYSYKMVVEARRPKTIGMLGTAFTTGASKAQFPSAHFCYGDHDRFHLPVPMVSYYIVVLNS